MKTPGIFQTHSVTIRIKSLGEPIQLVPFGDVHWKSPLHAHDIFNEFCEWGARQTNTYFLGMGDYVDAVSTSERAHLQSAKMHSDTITTLEDVWCDWADEFVEKTAFMRGRLIGLLEGNHYGDLTGGITTTQHMVTEYAHVRNKSGRKVRVDGMKPKYLGTQAFIRLKLIYNKNSQFTLDVFAHHGKGRGQTLGGQFNNVEHMARVADANIYIMGHSHSKGALPDQKIKLESWKSGLHVGTREVLLVRSGSFLKGFKEGKRSYVVDAAYRPLSLGWVTIRLIPTRTRMSSGSRKYHIRMEATV